MSSLLNTIASIFIAILRILGDIVLFALKAIHFLGRELWKIMAAHPKESLGFFIGASLVASLWVLTWWGCQSGDGEFVEVFYADAVRAPEGGIISVRAGVLGLRRRSVYLADVGVPNLSEPFGKDAQQLVNQMVAGKRICVKRMAHQPEGSGIVYLLNGECVQQRLVLAGYAYCRGKLWREEENIAKKEKRGLWSIRGFLGQPESG